MTPGRTVGAATSNPPRRASRRILLAGLVLAAGLWALLLLTHSEHAVGASATGAAPPALVTASTSASFWMLMMAAMMTPAALPWLGILAGPLPAGPDAARAAAGGSGYGGRGGFEGPYLRAGSLLLGYLAVWGLFSGLAAAAQLLLLELALLEPHTLRLGGRAAGGVLLLGGAWELSPIKEACLRHCRSPFGVLLTDWAPGPASGFRVGFRHGLTCLGCCWALMALAFVVGVVSLGGMALLTAVVCAEKLMPRGDRLSRFLGVALASAGVTLLAAG